MWNLNYSNKFNLEFRSRMCINKGKSSSFQGKRSHIAEESCQCSARNSCPSKRGQLPVKDRAAEDSFLCKKVQLQCHRRQLSKDKETSF
jgi:hypothetical protein